MSGKPNIKTMKLKILQPLADRATIIMNMLTLKQKLTSIKDGLTLAQRLVVILVLVAVTSLGSLMAPFARADIYEEQIQQIQQDSGEVIGDLAQLGSEAATLEEEVQKLQTQINALQAQIDANQAKSDDLKVQIARAEEDLAQKKKALGDTIRAMYVEGEMSTLEMLATSNDLSDFVDKQHYQEAIQNQIKRTVDQINALKAQLKDQQAEVEALLRDQKNMRAQLDSSKAYQNQLLSANQAQQNNLNQKLKENSARIADLRVAQRAANARLGGKAVAGDPNHGGYPAVWDNAPQDSMIDDWGMYNRECVSYTAWKVYERYGYMPYWGGHGNANEWPWSARQDGIPTGSTPRVHSVAVSMSGYYGHTMWVEAVSGNQIYVSQYNYGLDGRYSEMWINASNLIFIYFQ